MNTFILIVNILVIVSLFVFAYTSLIASTKHSVARIFGWFSSCTIIWIIFNYAAGLPYLSELLLLWLNRLTFISSLLVILLLFEFTSRVSDTHNRKYYTTLTVLTALIVLADLTPLVVSGVDVSGQTVSIQPGLLSILHLLLLLLMIVSTIVALIKIDKRSIYRKSLLLGISSALILIVVSNVILPLIFHIYTYTSIGTVFGFFIMASVGYSVVRHRLFDIRLVVAKASVYLLSLGILSVLYLMIVFGVGRLSHIGVPLKSRQAYLYVGIAFVFAVTLPYVKRFFDKVTNKIFYKDAYDVQEFIDQLNKTIVSDVRLHNLLNNTAEIIQNNVKTEFVTFGIKQTENLPQQVIGVPDQHFKQPDIDKVRRLTPTISSKIILTDELESDESELKEILSSYGIGMLVRLVTNVDNGKEGIGYIVLGYKRSGSPFNSTDVKTMEIIANSMVVAIQNSMRFEEIQHFNITLQKKVDDATRQLERTNKKLIAMDETKDEFISMASHQLRTPLTSVKGFISMLIDGDFGKVTPKQQEILKETFASSQRMVYLIADFLNVSRIRTGKFVIEPTEVNLSEIITQELSQLQEMATSREVTLKFDPPVNFPKVMLDENKIRQVMMNFIDNAIYYTPKDGTIKIQLYKTAKDIVYKVIDSGIGVPKSEQHKLFTKFFRAGNAQKARPDGTGLGLFMAQKVIVAQNGSTIFESVEGKGSTFGFSFPLGKVKITK